MALEENEKREFYDCRIIRDGYMTSVVYKSTLKTGDPYVFQYTLPGGRVHYKVKLYSGINQPKEGWKVLLTNFNWCHALYPESELARNEKFIGRLTRDSIIEPLYLEYNSENGQLFDEDGLVYSSHVKVIPTTLQDVPKINRYENKLFSKGGLVLATEISWGEPMTKRALVEFLLKEETYNFEDALLDNADLSGITFKDCTLKGASFTGCNTEGMTFINCDLANLYFQVGAFRNLTLDAYSYESLTKGHISKFPKSIVATWNIDGLTVADFKSKKSWVSMNKLTNTYLTKTPKKESVNPLVVVDTSHLKLNCKWKHTFNYDGSLKLGCYTKTLVEWEAWLDSDKEYETPRGTPEFARIEAFLRGVFAYVKSIHESGTMVNTTPKRRYAILEHRQVSFMHPLTNRKTTVYRIVATESFNGVNVGELGGFIESHDNLAYSGWVYDNARVYDNAMVGGQASVHGNAQVYDGAQIAGNAKIKDDAQVSGVGTLIGGDCHISGHGSISDVRLSTGKIKL